MANIIGTNLSEDVRMVAADDRLVVARDGAYSVGELTVHGSFEVGSGARADVRHLVNRGTVVNRGNLVARRIDNRPGAKFENRGAARIGSAHVENDNRGVIAVLGAGLLVLLATRNRPGATVRVVGGELSVDGILVIEHGAELAGRTGSVIEVRSGLYSAGLVLNGAGCTLGTALGVQVRVYAGGHLRNRGAIDNRGRIIVFGGEVRQLGTISGNAIEQDAATRLPY